MKLNCTYLVLLCFAINYSNTCLSQSVLSSSNGKLQAQEVILDWTVGETMITTIYDETNYTQGFLQPPIGYDSQLNTELLVEETDFFIRNEQVELSLYPNPVGENLNIEITIPADGMWNLSVYNITGQLLYTDQQYWSNEQKVLKNIDVSYFKSGQYFVRIFNEDNSSIKKFNVAH